MITERKTIIGGREDMTFAWSGIRTSRAIARSVAMLTSISNNVSGTIRSARTS